jgi:hypothetical protein
VVVFNEINFIGDDSTEAHNDGSTVKNGMNVSGNFGRDVVWSGLRCCQTCMNNPCVIAVGRRSAVSTTGSANSGESEGPFTQRRLASNSRAALQRLDSRARCFYPCTHLHHPTSQVVLGHQSVINVSTHQDYLIAIALQYGCSTFYPIAGGA